MKSQGGREPRRTRAASWRGRGAQRGKSEYNAKGRRVEGDEGEQTKIASLKKALMGE